MYFQLLLGVLCLSLIYYALLYVHSSYAIILKRKRKLVSWLLLSYIIMSCYCKCSVALPQDAMDWFAVCDCGIS